MKNWFLEKSTKFAAVSFFCTGALFILLAIFLKSYALVEPVESIRFLSKKLDYEAKDPGSIEVVKSAKWVDRGTARITFDIDTTIKEKQVNKDVILVLDVSESMVDAKLQRVKEDVSKLVQSILLDQDNKIALVTFESTSEVKLDFTNDQQKLLSEINQLYANNGTSYYKALQSVDHVLENYVPEEGRECLVLFLTDGYPNIDIPNQEGQYLYLKEKYPDVMIHGIQYELGKEVLDPIIKISDYQYIADMKTLDNILLEATTVVDLYDQMILTDWIDNNDFDIESISSINATFGTINLEYEGSTPKVTWTLNKLKSGAKEQLTIDIKIKEQEPEIFGILPTNKKEELYYKINGIEEDIISTDTPKLKSHYQVSYDVNLPDGCTIKDPPESQTEMPLDRIDISNIIPECEEYHFDGWVIVTEDTIQDSKEYFIMPEHDVLLRAEWSKMTITKSMGGEIYVAPLPILQQILWTYNDELWGYRSSITKIVIQDSITNILNTKESWDISKDKNGSVIGRLVPNGDNPTTYTAYIQGEGKVIANPYSGNLFKNFTQLETIEGLEHLDTSNVVSMSYMFRGSEKLTSIDLSHFDTSKVTDMSSMFDHCKGLTSIDVSHFDTKNVTNMSNMFGSCENLATLDVSHFNTAKVTNMYCMFGNCYTLTGLNLSSFDTSKVTNMDYMFAQNRLATSLDLQSFNTENVTTMYGMFRECAELTSLNISNFNTANVEEMTTMFAFCYKLPTVDVSHFNTSKVTGMAQMFQDCQSLTTLDVSHFDTSKVTNMKYMFSNCSVLPTIDVSGFNTTNVEDMSYMFHYCNYVTQLDVSHFNTANVTNMSFMFDSCYQVPSLNLKNFNTTNVTEMQNMFQACIALTELDLSSFNTEKVTNMQNMFRGDFYLSSINVSSFNTRNVTSMAYMFYDCQRVTSLNLNGFDTTSVVNIDHFFDRCTHLTATITIRFTSGTYAGMFEKAAIYGGKITVNYTSAASSFVNTLIATKSSNSNVVKGSLVA